MTTEYKRVKHAQRTAEVDALANIKNREIRHASDTKRLVSKLEDGTVLREGGTPTRYLERFSTLAAALTAISSTTVELIVSSTVTMTANATVPANVKLKHLNGGVINRNGFTLTINGPFEAGDHQVFSGAGSTVFGLAGETRVAWFYDGGGDYADAFNEAFLCRGSKGNKIINPSAYRLAIGSTIGWEDVDHIDWNGYAASAEDGTVPALVWTGSAGGTMFSSQNGSVGCQLRNLVFDGAYLSKWCMDINLMRRCDFLNITLTKTIGFIQSLNCYYSSFQRMLYFLQTPGTVIGTVGYPTLANWTSVCNSSSTAPICYRANANNLRLEKHSASRIGGYEIPSGAAALSQVFMFGGQNIKFTLPTIESIGMNTVGDPAALGFETGAAGTWESQLSFLVLSGVSALNSTAHVLYGNIETVTGDYRIRLYSDAAKSSLVAEGTRTGSGIVILNPMNSSGIRGQVTLTYTGDTTAADNTIKWDYDTITRIFNIQSGTAIDIDNVYMEAVNVASIATISKLVRTGLRFHKFYMEDCNFRDDLFESSTLHDVEITEFAGIGVTCAGGYVSNQSTSTYLKLDRIEFHNRFYSIGGVNYSDETRDFLGLCGTTGYAPIVYRPKVVSGFTVADGSDGISDYIIIDPGVIRDGLGRTVEIGRPESINSLETATGWLFRPPAGVADYNACVDAAGCVFIEDQASVRATAEQGKIILGTFHVDGSAAITLTVSISSPVCAKGIDIEVTGAVNVPGNFSVATNKFQVSGTNGSISLGAALNADVGFFISESLASLAGTSQRGVLSRPAFSSSATLAGAAGEFQLRTAAAAFTMTEGFGLRVPDAVKGAGSTITTQYGLKVEDQTAGGTNYAIYTGTGAVRFGGAVTSIGNLTVGSTKFQVDATLGVVGIGAASSSDIGIYVAETLTGLAGINQRGMLIRPVFSSSATTAGISGDFQLRTANASFTMVSGIGVRIGDASKGAASTITTQYGLKVEDQTAGGTNYAIYTGTGLVRFGGQVQLAASTTSASSIRAPHGSAPSSPVDGDIWTTTAGLFVRINGATVGPLS